MLPWMNCTDKYVKKISSSKHASAAAVFFTGLPKTNTLLMVSVN